MAVSAAPFALKNLAAGLDAEQLRQAVASTIPNTGGLVQSGDLAVTQTTVASLGVLVGVGRAWMPGTDVANVAGQSYSTQGQYFAVNDSPFTVNLDPANATNPRIDLIYIGAVDTQYGGATDKIWISKVTGTPAATPVVPTLPHNSIALAQVAVAATATTVTNANITAAVTNVASWSAGLVAQNNQTGGTSFTGATELAVSSVTANLVAGRSYRIHAVLDAAASLSNTYVQYRLKYGSTGGITGTNTRGAYTGLYTLANAGQSFEITGQPFIAPTTGASLCVLTGQIAVNTTATISSGSGTPAPLSITVEDLG